MIYVRHPTYAFISHIGLISLIRPIHFNAHTTTIIK